MKVMNLTEWESHFKTMGLVTTSKTIEDFNIDPYTGEVETPYPVALHIQVKYEEVLVYEAYADDWTGEEIKSDEFFSPKST